MLTFLIISMKLIDLYIKLGKNEEVYIFHIYYFLFFFFQLSFEDFLLEFLFNFFLWIVFQFNNHIFLNLLLFANFIKYI